MMPAVPLRLFVTNSTGISERTFTVTVTLWVAPFPSGNWSISVSNSTDWIEVIESGSIIGNPPNTSPNPVAFGFILIAALGESEITSGTFCGGLSLEKLIILSSSQPIKAPTPILVTLSGIVMLVRLVQRVNAHHPLQKKLIVKVKLVTV